MSAGGSQGGNEGDAAILETLKADGGLAKTLTAPISGVGATRLPPDSSGIAAPAPDGLSVSRGDALGRYVVLDLLGKGGMGEVYAAYDPTLDRKVALKVLRPTLSKSTSVTNARARLTKEAQAMAKLAHPNVIQVFDVGTVDGDVYVAMQFIEGLSLRDWLSTDRSVDEILAVFRSAALGLAAAHAAGLVHRDFKPDNVLVGKDGSVRVIDFGIASIGSSDEDDPDAIIQELSKSSANVADACVTLTGVAAGTPAYMAPEQFSAGSCDARTDQFSFAVALYEALYKEAPFAGRKIAELSSNVVEGKRRPIPASAEIAYSIESAIARSLQPDADNRFPSMHALLEALSPPLPWHRRHRVLLSIATASLVAVLLAMVLLRSEKAAEACQSEGSLLAGIWDQGRAEELQKHFATSTLPYAKSTAAKLTDQLNAHADAWKLARKQVCLAAQREDLSEKLKVRGIACLDRRLREIDATATILSKASDEIVKNAPMIVSGLSPIADCSNTTLLAMAGDTLPPEWLEVEDMLTELKILFGAAQHKELILRATEVHAIAVERSYAAGEGKALNWIGTGERATSKYEAAKEHFFEAIRVAQKEHAPAIAATAWEGLMSVAAANDKLGEGLRWQKHAVLANEQAGLNPELQARITYLHGYLLYKMKKFEEALAQLQAASALYEKIFGPSHFRVTAAMSLSTAALRRLGRLDEAVTLNMRALRIASESLGAQHPRLASMHNSSANTLGRLYRFPEAREHYQAAIRLATTTHGERSGPVGMYVYNQGLMEARAGKNEEALRLGELALELRTEVLGDGHAAVARAISSLATVYFRMGELKRAIELQQDVVRRNRLRFGKKDYHTANAQVDLCEYLRRAQEFDKAQDACRQALEILDSDAPDPRDLAKALTLDAWVTLSHSKDDKKLAATVQSARRAWEIREGLSSEPHRNGQARFVLALALGATGEGDQAREHALAAKTVIEAGEPGATFDLPAINAFLAKASP